jgi:hypothetical protein
LLNKIKYGRYLNRGIVVLYFISLMLLSAYILVNMMLGELYEGFEENFKKIQIDYDPTTLIDEDEEKEKSKGTAVKMSNLDQLVKDQKDELEKEAAEGVSKSKEIWKSTKVSNFGIFQF